MITHKNSLLWAFLLLSFSSIFAQEVSFKKDMALVDGNEYCQMTEEKVLLTRQNLTILNLIGDELFFIKLNVNKLSDNPSDNTYYNYYTLTNLTTKEEMEMELDLSYKKNVVKHLFQNQVINEDGTINEEGFQKFKIKYSCKCSETLATKLGNKSRVSGGGNMGATALPSRNRSAMIMVFGKEIKQANVLIGTYIRTQQAIQGGVEVRYTIYDSQQNLVAEATCTAFNAKSAQLTTAKDNRTYTVPFSFSTDIEVVKALAKTLTDKMYL